MSWNKQDVAYKVESEGLGYMVEHGLGASSIDDKELSMKWRQCNVLMNEIHEILSEYYDE